MSTTCGEQWLSTAEASRLVPYSAAYLSLLARKGRIRAEKRDDVWYIRKDVVEEYSRRQALRAQLQNEVAPRIYAVPPQEPLRDLFEEEKHADAPATYVHDRESMLPRHSTWKPLALAVPATLVTLLLLGSLELYQPERWNLAQPARHNLAAVSSERSLVSEIFQNVRGFFRSVFSPESSGYGRFIPPEETHFAEEIPTIEVASEDPFPYFDIQSIRRELSDLKSYIRTRNPDSPVVVYSSPSIDLEPIRAAIRALDIRPAVSRQSIADADLLGRAVSGITQEGIFTSPSISGGTITGAAATTTSLYVSGLASTTDFLANTATIGTLSLGTGTLTNLSLTGSTTLQNFTFANATGTSATTTNLFSTTGVFTNLTATDQTITDLIFTNATGTSATTTNLFSTKGTFTNSTTTNLYSSSLTAGTASSTNLFFTTGSGGNFTSSGLGTFSNLLINASSTLQNLTFVNATGTSATTTNLFSTTASSTNLFSTNSNLGVVTSGLINGQTISSAANFTGTLTATGGLSTLSNLLLTGSSTLQNFTFVNATGTSATTTNFFSTTASSTNLFSSLLTVGSTGLVVDASRNVGIGADPIYKFDVLGPSVSAAGGHSDVLRLRQGLDGGVNILFTNSVGALASLTASTTSTGAGTDDGVLIFGTATDGITAERMRISSSGKVGIGTVTTNGLLTLKNNVGATSLLSLQNYASTGEIAKIAYDQAVDIMKITNLSDFAAGGIDFATGSSNTTRMHIDTNGNVGIGTTTPNALLHVSGSAASDAGVKFRNTASSGYSGLDIFNEGGTLAGSLWVAGSTAGAANNRNAVTLASRVSGEKVHIVAGGYDPTVSGGITVSAGNVGIGTTGPRNRLDIENTDTTAYSATTYQGTINGLYLDIPDSGTAFSQVHFSTGNVAENSFGVKRNASSRGDFFWKTYNGTAYGERMTLTDAGNVGIGTTGPSSLLHLSATGNPDLRITNADASGRSWRLGEVTADAIFSIYDATASQSRLAIDSSGNVGIGTVAPANLLDVSCATSGCIPVMQISNRQAGSNYNTGYLEFMGLVNPGSNNNEEYKYLLGMRGDTTVTTDFVIRDMKNSADRLVIHASGSLSIGAGKALYLDGGINTYIQEASSDVINFVAGGTNYLQVVGGVGVNLDNHPTTASAANAFIDTGTGGTIRRSTSSLRYKDLIGDFLLEDARRVVLNAKAIRYTQKGGGAEHVGLAAEWMHELDPRFTTVDPEGRPDWVQYPHLVAPLMLVAQDHELRLENLEDNASSTAAQLASIASSFSVSSSTPGFIASVYEAFEAVIENGFTRFKRLAADIFKVGSREKPSGITLYDEVTGDPYCFRISNGVQQTSLGECPEPSAPTGVAISNSQFPISNQTSNDSMTQTSSDTSTSTTTDTTTSTTTEETIPTSTEGEVGTPTPTESTGQAESVGADTSTTEPAPTDTSTTDTTTTTAEPEPTPTSSETTTGQSTTTSEPAPAPAPEPTPEPSA